ncbi:MAG TPA: hypothetical protein VF707_20375 [Ardenticatenaceae bacterium]
MYGYHSSTGAGYYARPLRRAVGWWSVLPLWSIIVRTILTLVIGLGAINAIEHYLSGRGFETPAASAGLQETLLDLSTIVSDGTAVFGMNDLSTGVNREAAGLGAALQQMSSDLSDPFAGPRRTVGSVEGRADAVADSARRAGAVAGNIIDDADRALRHFGRDTFRGVERWLLSLRYW